MFKLKERQLKVAEQSTDDHPSRDNLLRKIGKSAVALPNGVIDFSPKGLNRAEEVAAGIIGRNTTPLATPELTIHDGDSAATNEASSSTASSDSSTPPQAA